jgi:hypothetical protein
VRGHRLPARRSALGLVVPRPRSGAYASLHEHNWAPRRWLRTYDIRRGHDKEETNGVEVANAGEVLVSGTCLIAFHDPHSHMLRQQASSRSSRAAPLGHRSPCSRAAPASSGTKTDVHHFFTASTRRLCRRRALRLKSTRSYLVLCLLWSLLRTRDRYPRQGRRARDQPRPD